LKKAVVATLSVLTVLLLVSIAPRVYAQEEHDPWVATYDTDNNPRDVFLVRETVRIVAYSSATPYTIQVWTSEDGGTNWSHVKDITSPSNNYLDDHMDISEPPAGRQYELSLFYSSKRYGIATYFVIPELPFGTAMGTTASFGALSGLVTSRRLRLRRQKNY